MHFKRMCILGLFRCSILQISVKSNRSIVSFRISVALLIFCLKDLSNAVSGVSKSPTIIIVLSTFLFMSVSICVICLGTPLFGEYMLMNVNVISPCIGPLYYIVPFFMAFLLKPISSDMSCDPHFLTICMKYHFLYPHFQS